MSVVAISHCLCYLLSQCTLLLFTVCLVILFAGVAVQTCRNLCANADSIPDLDRGHLGTDLDRMANDLCSNLCESGHHSAKELGLNLTMSRDNWPYLIAPTAGRSVNVGTTNSARNNLHVDVIIAERFRFELFFVSV